MQDNEIEREIKYKFMQNKTFHITTFGCQMNEHDSEVMAGMLLEKGFTPVKERKDAD